MKKIGISLLMVSLFVLLISGSAFAEGNIAVVFATGGLGDESFNDMAYNGLLKAEEELGIESSYSEPNAVAQYEDIHTRYANTGNYDLIIGIGFDQADAIEIVASRFPDQKFAIVDQVVDADNVASLVFDEIERGFLPGVAAALMTTKEDDSRINPEKRIGVIGGMNIPLINSNIKGFMAGAKYIDPEIEVLHSYVGAWDDPATGKELTLSMFEEGVDIVWGAAGRSGLGVINAAEEENKYAIGSNSDQSHLAPENVLTNGMKFVDTAVYNVIKDVINDEFKSGKIVLGLEAGAVGYTDTLLPDNFIKEMEKIREKVIDGSLNISDYVEEL